MQIIWRAALSSSHRAMHCCHHSVSIARSRLMAEKYAWIVDASVHRHIHVCLCYPSPRFLCRPMAFCSTCWSLGMSDALSIRKTADLPLQFWVGTFRRNFCLYLHRQKFLWNPNLNEIMSDCERQHACMAWTCKKKSCD
jgi:hypothetical protein